MSQDISDSKRGIGSIFPEKVYDGVGFDRIEPFLIPEVFKRRFLFGLPLYSPITKEKITEPDLKDYILRGANLFELDSHTTVSPTLRRTKQPFDPALYSQFCYLEIPFKPIQNVCKLAITAANYKDTPQQYDKYPAGGNIFEIPKEWIEVANMNRGVINVVPMQSAFSAIGITTSAPASGAAIMAILGMRNFVPAYWEVEVMVGFCNATGDLPMVINEAIGYKAAMLLIDNLIPQFHITSQSLGIDAMSQSVGDQMYQLLIKRRELLEADYKSILKRIKTLCGNKLFSSNI